MDKLLSDYKLGEYVSLSVGDSHSSNESMALGDSINGRVEAAWKWHGVALELIAITTYVNAGVYRCVFKVTGYNYGVKRII